MSYREELERMTDRQLKRIREMRRALEKVFGTSILKIAILRRITEQ